jgi:hypothetical protein
MKKIQKILIPLLFLIILIVPLSLSAQSGTTLKIGNPVDCGLGGDNNNCTIMTLIVVLLNKIVMPIAAIAVVLWIIWAGFSYVLAQGKPAEVSKAHQRLLWSLVGAGILLGAAGISQVVELTVRELMTK